MSGWVARPGRLLRPLAAMLFGSVATPSLARADDVDTLGGQVVDIEGRLRDLDAEIRTPTAAERADAAERRLIDAQVLYELKNYEAASTLLLDIVQKYPKSTVYSEALFYLADALYLWRDFLSSRRYFEQVITEVGPSGRRYQETLQRLIELSLHTGDYGPVDGYLAKLAELPAAKQLPTVPYIKGKYFYFRRRYDEALRAFAELPPGHVYWFHSQYFVGATQVGKGQLTEALATFDGILKAEPKTASERRIGELAHLALGRLYYDRGQFTNANTEYSKISQKSDYFTDALYEQAWVSIKAKEFKKAFYALDLLLTAKPDDPQIPEVKLLIGNLHIRENEYPDATKSFTKTRDDYEPVHKQLDAILAKQPDQQTYFQELVSKNLGKLDAQSFLPQLAVKWVRATPEMQRVVNVATDVNDIKRSLDESQEIVTRLEKAVNGPQKVNIFPELARARTKALEAANDLTEIERKLLERVHELLDPVAGGERGELDRMRADRQKLEAQLASMPRSAESYEERMKRARGEFDLVDKRAVELKVTLASLAAQRVAIEKYYADTKLEQKGLTPERDAAYQAEIGQYKAVEDELTAQYEALRREIDDATQSVGIDDPQMQQEATARDQLNRVMQRERELQSQVRARLGGAERGKADQIESILNRAHSAEKQIGGLNGRIDELVEERLKDIRVEIAEEKVHVAEHRGLVTGHEGETVAVGGGITAETFRAVALRFYQIVVRADVGIIDVAWALKQSRTDENQRLVREQKREIKLLDDEFKEVLKE